MAGKTARKTILVVDKRRSVNLPFLKSKAIHDGHTAKVNVVY
jgi:hypothetical protein